MDSLTVLVDKKFWKRLEYFIVILGDIQSWQNSVEFIKIYWIFPLDLSKVIIKISRVTGFFSMFILSKQMKELINKCPSHTRICLLSFKEIGKYYITDNGTSVVRMRAIVSNSDQIPLSVDVATFNYATV